jgi:hypothetical protein
LTNNPFEIPQDMRAALDQHMQQAHAAYDQVSDLVTKTIHSWMTAAPANPMLTGFQDIQSRAMDFAKENAEATFSLASKISYAKSPQEVLSLQTQFAQTRLQAFTTQIQELYSLSGEAMRKSQHG